MFELIDHYFEVVADKISLPPDQFKVVFTFLICIPLGQIHRLIKNPFLRNLFSLLIGAFLQYSCIKVWSLILWGMSTWVYILAVIFKKNCSIPVFISSFGLLVAFHTHRYLYDADSWSVSGDTAYMMGVCKMIYFAFYYSDGRIEQLPGILEYYGYTFFYASIIVGPVYEFGAYSDFIHLSGQYKNLPNSIKKALYELMISIIFTIGLMKLTPLYPVSYLISDELNSQPFIHKVWIFFIAGYAIRFQYFAGFKFAQTAMDATGISFNGYDEKTKLPKFDRIRTMDQRFELSTSAKEKSEMWNTSVQLWLKNCFYTRVTKFFNGNSLKSVFVVFLISALWHGVHPAYYVGFFNWGIMGENSKFIYKARHQFAWIPSPIRSVTSYIYSTFAISNVGFWIYILDFKKAFAYFSSIYFFMTFVELTVFLFFLITQYGQSSRSKVEGKEKQQK